MGLKRGLTGRWFSRVALVVWIISAVALLFVFKQMELIVHGQLYYYGLRFSPDWADPYRLYTWLIYLFLGLPAALSGVALAASFAKVTEKVPEKKIAVEQPVAKPPQPVAREERKTWQSNSVMGISCPHCNKVFSRALAMLDFRSGKPKIVSVCPYCNYVLGSNKEQNDDTQVGNIDEKLPSP
jgi:hypothetical protein